VRAAVGNTTVELDFFTLFRLLLRRKAVVAGFAAFFLLCAVAYVLIASPMYTAHTTILPTQEIESSPQLGNFQNLASQFGLLSLQSGNLSDIFPAVLQSEALIVPLLDSTFSETGGDRGKPLIQYLNIEEDDPYRARRRGYETLLENISVSVDERSRLITLSVTMAEPWLAARLANVMAKKLNDFTIDYKTSDAEKFREFLEEQVRQKKEAYDEILNELASFKQENLNYLESPELNKQFQMLELERQARLSILIQAREQYELARIQEVKDTPTIKVLDTAEIPVEPSHPRTVLILGLSLVIGFAFGCFSVIIVDRFFASA